MRPCTCAPRRAVGLGKSGTVYIGVNLEFPGLPLNNSVSHLCLLPLHSCDMSDHEHFSAAKAFASQTTCIFWRSTLSCHGHS